MAAALRAAVMALLLGFGMALAMPASAQTCVPNTVTDWMVSSEPLAQVVRPTDCATVEQTPPDFRWPDVIASGGYTLTLTYPDGHSRTLAATQNWLNWDEILAPGRYSWTVGYAGGSASRARQFVVDANSKPFLVPNMANLLATVAAKARPRSLPDAAALAAMRSQRLGAFLTLQDQMSGRVDLPLPSQGVSAGDAYTFSDLALSSLMLCIYGGEDLYCNDAVRRVMNLASWDPNGATSYLVSGVDMGARHLTWTVALGYDWLFPRLNQPQRDQILSMLSIRNGVMYNDIVGSRSRIARQPRDSHGNQTLSFVALISALVAGDLPQADTWLLNTLPFALNAVNPWSDEEGGFANGEAQGNWDVGEMVPVWSELKYTTGIDLAQKPWVRNWGRFFTYFTPPGMANATTVFGDGFEISDGEHQARYGKGYTYLAPTPLGRWHMSLLRGEDQMRIEYLMAPPADFAGPQVFPAGTPNSLYLASIGQVAMHSNLANTLRTSVYFKSSPPPYGAFNHSHADQNSFVVNAGGQRLAIESGYYDGYESPHWTNWYHTTKAKNAITYDGGQGQLFFEQNARLGYGQITGFKSTAAYDVVSGDATPAYGGALTLAQRSLVYLRPNLILVYDKLASATNRQWEWNIHAVNPMNVASNTQVSIQNNGQSLCIDMLAGPPMLFTQSGDFNINPSGNWIPQWHGTFYSAAKLPATEFIALLNVGCVATAASATQTAGGWTVQIGGMTVAIPNGAGGGNLSSAISVTPSATTVLEMPWFTQASGYISRLVLLNTGATTAFYNIAVLTESGNTAQINSLNSSGSIPANQQFVIDINSLIYGFSAGQRGAAIVNANVPRGTLTGIYNLVQPITGAISNVSLLKGQDFTSPASTLIAPWFTTASGYNSAFVFSNYGTADATATVNFLAPPGTAVTPMVGNLRIPAQSQLIVDANTMALMSGTTDGAAVFNLNAPEGNVKGVYKTVSMATGSTNSTELVNPQSTGGSTTRLVAPWFSTAPGYASSFILVNRGASAADYAVTVMTETGNTAMTTASLTGSIPAGSQIILPAASIVAGFTGATRAAAIFDVGAVPANIEGMYKIASQETGSISTTILARTDTSSGSTTSLKLPWFSGASGYVSRFVLVNTGFTDAPFTLQIYPEAGNGVAQTATGGTIPAQGQLVLPVANVVVGFGGATRAAAVFTVTAPAADIYGLYNIVNPASGTISNTLMGK